MPSRALSRISKIVRGNLPDYGVTTIIPRGYAIPVDTFLVGRDRFARRLGSVFPILSPHNTMFVSRAVKQNDATIYVEELLPSVPVGSIVSFVGKEKVFVHDTDTTNKYISLESGVYAAYSERTQVYLHSIPVTLVNNVVSGATVVTVDSNFVIVLNDSIEELSDSDIPGSGSECNVSGITVVQETSQPFRYTLTLSCGLINGHSAGSFLYLRAYPAYKSRPIPLPTQPTVIGDNVGPFLWDIAEGRLHDGIDDPEVYLSIETISSAFYTLDSMSTTAKNTPHYRVPIPATSFLFWDIKVGTLNVDGYYTAVHPNEDGDFVLSKEIIPDLPAGQIWRASFYSDTVDTALRIGFHLSSTPAVAPILPSADYEYVSELNTVYLNKTIPVSKIWPVVIQSPNYSCDRIEINGYVTDATNKMLIREWSQDGGRSSWVRYAIVSRVNGDYTWASSGLIVKPIFFTKDHLQLLQRFNSGAVMI